MISTSGAPERQLCIARIDDVTAPRFVVDESMRPFVAFLALDGGPCAGEELGTLAEAVLDQGCVCALGNASMTSSMEVVVGAEVDGKPYATVVMTTWYSDESLDDALWYSIFAAFAADAEPSAVIALSEANVARAPIPTP